MSRPPKSRTLVIFDVDGTLFDANVCDSDCFDRAFQEVVGMALAESEWSTFTEVTAQAIIHQALGANYSGDIVSVETRIRDSFLTRLQTVNGRGPASIRAFEGALNLFSALRSHADFHVAIATGCWRETAHFKLTAAGFDLENIPFASASDCYSRADIIRLAAERAGMNLQQAVYVGDGPWDLRATRQLGIPFIGVGHKREALRNAGARHTLDHLCANALSELIRQIREEGRGASGRI